MGSFWGSITRHTGTGACLPQAARELTMAGSSDGPRTTGMTGCSISPRGARGGKGQWGFIIVPEMLFQPMPLSRRAEPFNHLDWLLEITWDGFRALLYSDSGSVRLISRNGNTFKAFPDLCEGLARPEGPPLHARWRNRLPRFSFHFAAFSRLKICIDQVTFMEQLVQPDRRRARILM
jgi:hypothetical protein